MAHGVRIVQSLSDMTSLDRAAAEWYLSGKFGSHWPELMGHDQAGSSYVRIPIDSLLTLVPICGSMHSTDSTATSSKHNTATHPTSCVESGINLSCEAWRLGYHSLCPCSVAG
jgi:hypothetical protein